MTVVTAAHKVGVQRVDRPVDAVDLPDSPGRSHERLREDLTAEHPTVGHPLTAADEDHRGELAEVGLVVARHTLVAHPRLAELLQIEDVEQVGDRIHRRLRDHPRRLVPSTGGVSRGDRRPRR